MPFSLYKDGNAVRTDSLHITNKTAIRADEQMNFRKKMLTSLFLVLLLSVMNVAYYQHDHVAQSSETNANHATDVAVSDLLSIPSEDI